MLTIIFVSLVLICSANGAAEKLSSYNVDPSETSVSGLSSGAFFATQMHVAFSSSIKGAGIVAGGPYDCASQTSYTSCMYTSSPSVAKPISNTKSWSGNKIDEITHLARQKIYMISGTSDTTVGPAVMNQLYKYYVTDGQFIPASNVVFKKDLKSAHTFPTDFDSAGNNACGSTSSPYISNCAFDGAGAILAHIYGPLKARNNGQLNGRFIEISQGEFLPSPKTYGMDESGWLYVPKDCANGATCKLHIAYHGCLQGFQKIGDKFVKNTGYNRWADTNQIIVLYPQAVSTNTIGGGGASLPNANGCWDWIGWYGADFDVKSGKQLAAMKKMIDRVTSGFNPIAPPADLQVVSVSDNAVSLQWKPVADASGYHVYRNGQRANDAPLVSTSYTDGQLQSGTSFQFVVRAVSRAGAESAPSNTVTGKTTGTPPSIQIPTGLAVTTVTTNSVTLNWDATGGATSYNVFRNGNKVSSSPSPSSPTFVDTGLSTGTEYRYQISSVRGTEESDKSAEVKATTATEKVCYNDNNYNHVVQGRAYQSGGNVFANGSNQKMGLYNIFVKTNLCKTKENFFVIE